MFLFDFERGKGMEEVLKHAADFIEKRLAPASPPNNGKKTHGLVALSL
jgi:hypothetical protein